MARTRKWRLRWAAGLTAVMTAAVLSANAPPAQAAPAGRISGVGETGSVSGSYIVTLKGGTRAPSSAGAAVAGRYGARISHTYGAALNGFAVRADARRARRLAADPRVASVVQDTRVTFDGVRVAGAASGRGRRNPPSWGLDRIDQAGRPLDGRYTAPGSAGSGVTVYVIDTGVRITHRDFGGRASYGWDFVDDDGTAQDGNGHGTHVAGTVAGTGYGVAKRARVVAVRVLDDRGAGSTAQVIAGIDWVTRHARKPAVANLSLGGYANTQLDAAVRNSIASGVTYTVAAGNSGMPASLFSPARVPGALTVGATGRTDARAGFSNTGSSLDLFAPGVDITSTSYTGDRARATSSGTSMASPHAAGAAALYLADHPRDAPAQVVKALVRRAVPGKVSGAGPGSPNRLLRVG
ncbi:MULTISPECIES: S8 family peptidase [unclassified Streptomyces]|uniref:S8 family peptidase n=1 Tax=unclassified Streptomyces TaxID=2593676 RepID=UPI002DDBF01B|nr:S8 family peptidase [Streptomyces sp. NBC_00151]WRZ39346.1 S8 family peptidase [Streptomyces sp. NBC_00151]